MSLRQGGRYVVGLGLEGDASHPLPAGVSPAVGSTRNVQIPEAETRQILKFVSGDLFF